MRMEVSSKNFLNNSVTSTPVTLFVLEVKGSQDEIKNVPNHSCFVMAIYCSGLGYCLSCTELKPKCSMN